MAMTTDRMRGQSLGIQRPALLSPSRWTAAGPIVGELVTRLLIWLERARERRQLLSLSDRALRDFGKSRADAESEGYKPFWRA
jgi:uncharacterized protein YjiS (DUF1127 family)